MNSLANNETTCQNTIPQQAHQNQANQHQRNQSIAEFIEAKRYTIKIDHMSQEIQTLKRQLDQKNRHITGLQQKIPQIEKRLRSQKDEELNIMKRDWESKEQQLAENRKYIQQAEKRRYTSLDEFKNILAESHNKSQNLQKLSSETVEINKLKADLSLKEEQKLTLSTKIHQLKQQLSSSKEAINKKQDTINSLQLSLSTLKEANQRREAENKQSVIEIEGKYRQLQQSLRKENKSIKDSYEKELDKLKNKHTAQITTKQKQLQNIIKNQSQSAKLIQKLKKEKTQYELKHQKYSQQTANQIKSIKQSNSIYIQSIKSLENKITNIQNSKKALEVQLNQTKLFYDKKAQQLTLNYKRLEENLQKTTQNQKIILEKENVTLKQQLQGLRKGLEESKKKSQQQLKQVKAQSKRQSQQVRGKLVKSQTDINRISGVIKQLKNILSSTGPSFRNIPDDQLTTKFSQYIEIAKKDRAILENSLKEATKTNQLLLQICQKNSRFIKIVEDCLKTQQSLSNMKQLQERADDANHLGLLINSLVTKMKALLSQKDQNLKLNYQSVKTLTAQNNEFRKDAQVKVKLLEKLKTRMSSLQSQNRGLSQRAQSQRILREKTQQNSKQSASTLSRYESELKQLTSKLQTSETFFNQEKYSRELLSIKMQSEKAAYQLQVNKLKEEHNRAKKQLQVSENNLNLQKELNRKLSEKSNEYSQRVKTLELNIKYLQAEMGKLQLSTKEKEQLLKKQLNEQIAQITGRLGKTIKSAFGSEPERTDIDGIIAFLLKNAGSTANTALTVSHILQRMPKQRSLLLQQCYKFFGTNSLTTKLSFKYDQFSKNFSNYLPTLANKFLFGVVMKTKKNVVFGVMSYWIGRESKAFAFNLNTMKIMHKSPKSKVSSTAYESSMLKFGNEEIIIRNNSNLEIKINTLIIGERYFDFSKEDLVGKEEGETVLLEAMEIHRLTAL